jgi:hypothetical protein
MTWRPSDELLERVRRAAERQGRSMNEYVSAVLDIATNPHLAGTEVSLLRERLDRAGLLAHADQRHRRPPAEEVVRARAAAGRGTPLSTLISEDR